jgi:hypothetical protein
MNNKKILTLGVIGIFSLMFATQMVLALSVNDEIAKPDWLLGMVEFFNLGTTWADVIVAAAIILMIFAATYDILGFTAFEKDWVKYSIAAGVALVSAVVGVINALAIFVMGLVGGSVLIATLVAIGFAIVFFVIGTFWKGKMKVWKAKRTATSAKGGFMLSAATTEGHIREARVAAGAADKPKSRKY